jgi:hypothetical protein
MIVPQVAARRFVPHFMQVGCSSSGDWCGNAIVCCGGAVTWESESSGLMELWL